MKLAIGSDHAGYFLKEALIPYLKELGHDVLDMGTQENVSVDYPVYGRAVGRAVASHTADRGIAICGTGIGISVAANKVKGIRATLAHNVETATLARSHNDSNVLAMGARVVDTDLAKAMVKAWLETPFEGGRHQGRVDQLMDFESEDC